MDKLERIEQRISAEFPSCPSEARRVLNGALFSRTVEVGYERLAGAILTLANGDLARLEHFAQAAQVDTRDVLFWAENPPDPDESKTYEDLRARLGLPTDDGSRG